MSKGKSFYDIWIKSNFLFAFWFGTCDTAFRGNNSIDEAVDELLNIINKIYNMVQEIS